MKSTSRAPAADARLEPCTGKAGAVSSAHGRFTGADGLRRLTEAFAAQPLVAGDAATARALAAASTIETYGAGAEIVTQGSADTDIFFVLVGSVKVERNGRPGPFRTAGSHFGEMAMIDVHVRRSATVCAAEETVVARISEWDFATVAQQQNPELWRRLAIEISRRLTQRLDDVPLKNSLPRVFIGSSTEGLRVAEEIRAAMASPHVEVVIWKDGVFGPSQTNIESLEGAVRGSDMAVLVLSADDKVRSRGKTLAAPRDNVVFELGLFMGALGRARTFIVGPRGDLKIPSDLLGVTLLNYETDEAVDLRTRLASASDALKSAIERLGPK